VLVLSESNLAIDLLERDFRFSDASPVWVGLLLRRGFCESLAAAHATALAARAWRQRGLAGSEQAADRSALLLRRQSERLVARREIWVAVRPECRDVIAVIELAPVTRSPRMPGSSWNFGGGLHLLLTVRQ
jgi:hypothetical protein